MIIEPERSGKTVSDVCIAFGVSRETWYKWKRRYDTYGIDGLKNQSRKPHNIIVVVTIRDLLHASKPKHERFSHVFRFV